MRPAPLLFVALSLASITAVAPARAQKPPTIIDQDRAVSDHADELFRAGNELAKKDHWTEAEPLFRQAWALKHSYDIAGNLGIAEASLRRWRDAAEHLSFALRSFPANGKPEHKKLLEGTLARALPEVATLTLMVTPEKAEVLVDGKSVGTAPLVDVVFVEAGQHRVEAKLRGYDDGAATVEAASGRAQPVTLRLALTAALLPPVKEAWRPGVAVLVTGGALAATGIVAGIGLTVAANGKSSDADMIGARLGGPSTCTGTPAASVAANCTAVKSALRSQSVLTDAAKGTFVTGGLLTLASAGLAIWAGLAPAQRGTGLRVAPLVGAREGGVTMVGTW